MAHHDFPGIKSHADLDLNAMRATDLFAIVTDALLHRQGRVAGADRMVLMRDRRAEQSHDAIAHHLIDGPLIAVDRRHHPFQHGVEEQAGLLGVAVSQHFMEPFRSAKSTVTCLRSPSSMFREVRIFSARWLGV